MKNKLVKMAALGGLALFLTAAILKSQVKPAQSAAGTYGRSSVVVEMPSDSAFVLNGPTLLYRER